LALRRRRQLVEQVVDEDADVAPGVVGETEDADGGLRDDRELLAGEELERARGRVQPVGKTAPKASSRAPPRPVWRRRRRVRSMRSAPSAAARFCVTPGLA
jgi:hypothetical protein